jgi:Fe(3+) dicitrate transport protein
MFDWNLNRTFFEQKENFIWNVFSNIALTEQYLKSDAPNIEGNKVEFVPLLTLRQERELQNFMSSLTYVCLLTIYRSQQQQNRYQ